MTDRFVIWKPILGVRLSIGAFLIAESLRALLNCTSFVYLKKKKQCTRKRVIPDCALYRPLDDHG